MNETIAILSVVLVVLGSLGSVLPILPGPPLVWVALLLLRWAGMADFSNTFLVITALITLAIEVLDYLLPIWLTKKSGGSNWGQRGALAGMVIGIVVGGPVGILIGPVIGAVVGELLHDARDARKAVKSGLYAFIGFLLTSGIALVWCAIMGWQVFKALGQAGFSWLT